MSWNYRVVKSTNKSGIVTYAIHEAFYNVYKKTGEIKIPEMITQEPVLVSYELDLDEETTPKEVLRETLQLMLKALDAPIVEWDKKEKVCKEVEEAEDNNDHF